MKIVSLKRTVYTVLYTQEKQSLFNSFKIEIKEYDRGDSFSLVYEPNGIPLNS